jgi:uncharacterized protein (TIRG00374 family)
VAGLVVSIGLLYWTLHDVRLGDVLGHARRARVGWLVAGVALATLTFPIRTLRWRLILRDVDGHRLPLVPLWRALAVGFMANNLLPARAGEVARAYMANRLLPVRFTTALASVGVERVFDGLVMVGLIALGVTLPSFPRDATIEGVRVARIVGTLGVVFGAALVTALLVVHRPALWLGLARRLLGRVLPTAAAQRLVSIAEGLVAGLSVFTHPGHFIGVVTWSLVLWVVNAASFWAVFRAFDLALPPEASIVLQGLIGFGVAVPASPGFVGVFEAITRVTLGFYGVPADLAVSYAVTYHITTFVPITVLGLVALSRAHIGLRELRARPATDA